MRTTKMNGAKKYLLRKTAFKLYNTIRTELNQKSSYDISENLPFIK